MLTLKELDKIWEQEIQPQITMLEEKYKKNTGIHIFVHFVIFVISALIFFKIVLPGLGIEPDSNFYIFLFLPNIIYSVSTSSMCAKHKDDTKIYYNSILNPLGINHSLYDTVYISGADVGNFGFFGANTALFDDIFTGKYKNVPYQIVETTLKSVHGSGKYRSSKTVFEGAMIVVNDFIGVNGTVVYVDNKFERDKVTTEQDAQITDFITNARTNISGYKGLFFSEGKLFILVESEGNMFELPAFNIKKSDFIHMLEDFNNFLILIDKLNLQEKYKFPQDELVLKIEENKPKTFWDKIGLFLLCFILCSLGAYVLIGIGIFSIVLALKIESELVFLCINILPIIVGFLFALHVTNHELKKEK